MLTRVGVEEGDKTQLEILQQKKARPHPEYCGERDVTLLEILHHGRGIISSMIRADLEFRIMLNDF